MYTEEQIQNVLNQPYITVGIDKRGKCKVDACKKEFTTCKNMTTDEVIQFLKGVRVKPIVMMEFDYDALAMRGTYVKKTTLYKMLEKRKETLGY